jgi:triosephosphate isomerase
MIIVNFKNYKVGKEVLDLIRTIDIHSNKALVAVPSTDLKDIAKETAMPVYAQAIDLPEKGTGTGKLTPEQIFATGAAGSILNHSENKLPFATIKKITERCNELNLKLIICASTLKEAEKIRRLSPYAIAFEDPKLLSGKSLKKAKNPSINKFINLLKNTDIIPICGAGISTPEDVAQALMLGCKGILVSSVIANSQNPEHFLKDISGLF